MSIVSMRLIAKVPAKELQESGHADGDDPHGDDTVIHAEEDYVRPRYSSRLAD